MVYRQYYENCKVKTRIKLGRIDTRTVQIAQVIIRLYVRSMSIAIFDDELKAVLFYTEASRAAAFLQNRQLIITTELGKCHSR